jgi:hypothetical protein
MVRLKYAVSLMGPARTSGRSARRAAAIAMCGAFSAVIRPNHTRLSPRPQRPSPKVHAVRHHCYVGCCEVAPGVGGVPADCGESGARAAGYVER